MRNRSFIVNPTSLATQLSAISGRLIVNKEIPAVVVKGRAMPIVSDVPGAFGNAKRAKLQAAIAAFNAA